jgi:hypothetical protein
MVASLLRSIFGLQKLSVIRTSPGAGVSSHLVIFPSVALVAHDDIKTGNISSDMYLVFTL